MLKYVHKKSVLHNMSSTIKLIILITLSILIFAVKNYFILNIFFIIVIILLVLSKIEMLYYIKTIKYSITFVIITFLLNMLFSDIIYSLMISYRIFIMIMYTLIYTLTTKSMDIVYAITNILYPLKLFKINTKDISLIVWIGINFMPILIREYIVIKEAQKSKGYVFKIKKVKQYCLCIFIPYLSNCFKKVDEIALALQVKWY